MRTHTIHKQAPILQMIPTQDKRHTASPWQFQQKGEDYLLKGSDSTTILRIRTGTIPTNHDARLIASAPIMLDALQAVADRLDSASFPKVDLLTEAWIKDSLLLEQVKDAIRKATE